MKENRANEFKPDTVRHPTLGEPDEYLDLPMPADIRKAYGLHADDSIERRCAMIAASRCAGWEEQPDAAAFEQAWRNRENSVKAYSIINAWLSERSEKHILQGWLIGLYTPRSAVQACKTQGIEDESLARALRPYRTTRERWMETMRERTRRPGTNLRLPEPPAALWKRLGSRVRGWLKQAGIENTEWAIGGGSILAARWRHRNSDDIDIAMTAKGGIVRLKLGVPDLREQAESLGAEYDEDLERRIIHMYWKGVGEEKQGIDLFEDECEPYGGIRITNVEREPTRVLDNAQILWGKLDRGELRLVRDLFDLATAAEHDPEALRAAVNGHPQSRIEKCTLIWRNDAVEIEKDATEGVQGIADSERTTLHELPERAVGATEAARYTQVRLGAEAGNVIAHRNTRNGPLPVLQWKPGRVERLSLRRGIALYLDHAGVHGESVLRTAEMIAAENRPRIWCFKIKGTTVTRWDAAMAVSERYKTI